MDGQGSGGYRLGGIPSDEPECRMVVAGKVTAGDLQIATDIIAVAGGVTLCIRYRGG